MGGTIRVEESYRKRGINVKVLVVGPSDKKSRGGMATVISGMRKSEVLNSKFDMKIHESYIDSKFIDKIIFCVISFLKYIFIVNKYDLIHIHMATRGSTYRKMAYAYIAQKRRKKVIIHIHGADFPEFTERLTKKKQYKIKTFLQSVDMVIGLSDEWKERLTGLYDLQNCEALANGIDTKEFKTAYGNLEKNLNEFVLLGRLGERKGVYDLILAMERAVKINPKIKLYLAGDGDVEKVNFLICEKKLQNNIEVVGWIDYYKKISLLKKVATVVLPSYYEGLPMSILEGMAAGKAIISTTVGAIPEVVEAENGIVLKPGDIEALTEALIRCSTNVEMVASMSKNNIDKISKKFSMRIMHEKLSEFYYSMK